MTSSTFEELINRWNGLNNTEKDLCRDIKFIKEQKFLDAIEKKIPTTWLHPLMKDLLYTKRNDNSKIEDLLRKIKRELLKELSLGDDENKKERDSEMKDLKEMTNQELQEFKKKAIADWVKADADLDKAEEEIARRKERD